MEHNILVYILTIYSVTDVVELSDVAKDKKVLENIFSEIRCNLLHADNNYDHRRDEQYLFMYCLHN